MGAVGLYRIVDPWPRIRTVDRTSRISFRSHWYSSRYFRRAARSCAVELCRSNSGRSPAAAFFDYSLKSFSSQLKQRHHRERTHRIHPQFDRSRRDTSTSSDWPLSYTRRYHPGSTRTVGIPTGDYPMVRVRHFPRQLRDDRGRCKREIDRASLTTSRIRLVGAIAFRTLAVPIGDEARGVYAARSHVDARVRIPAGLIGRIRLTPAIVDANQSAT